jgi:pimeloyl-ACP methyl ester carboxylesterase
MSGVEFSSPEEVMACLERRPSVVETPFGPVQYAEAGEGPPLLCVHGGPGGYDQALVLGDIFRKNGFRIIAPSRPGYLGTPLSTGESMARQADALAALLDSLGVDKAGVVGVSAGGGPMYELAARRPEKAAVLVAVDAVAKEYDPPVSDLEQKLFINPLGFKLTALLGDYLTKAAVQGMIATESTLDRKLLAERVEHIISDPLKRAYFKAMMHSIGDHAAKRVPGAKNDMAQLPSFSPSLEGIRCPTLIVHGTADNDVPPDHARHAAAAIPGAKLAWVENGSHFCFWLADGAAAVRERVVLWLKERMWDGPAPT